MTGHKFHVPLADFKLTAADENNPLWLRIRGMLEAEVEVLRLKNDSDQNIAATTMLRGEIRLAKRMLALAVEAGPTSRLVDADEGADDAFPAS